MCQGKAAGFSLEHNQAGQSSGDNQQGLIFASVATLLALVIFQCKVKRTSLNCFAATIMLMVRFIASMLLRLPA